MIVIKSVFLRFPNGLDRAFTLSYDDGVSQDTKLFEIFKKNNLKCTFNLNGGQFGLNGKRHRLNKEEAQNLYDQNLCEIACHTFSHPSIADCKDHIVLDEVVTDRITLEKTFGSIVKGMAYPNGSYNQRVEEIFELAGIVYARTTKSTNSFKMPTNWLELNPTCHHDNPKLFELAEIFLNSPVRRVPMLFYVWGHSYEFDEKNNWNLIERFSEKMANKDNVFYGTNIEIYNCFKNFNRLTSSTNGDLWYNPTESDVWVSDVNGKVFCIKSGETLKL